MRHIQALSILALSGISLTSQAIENIEMNSFLTIGAASISAEGHYLDRVTENISFENDSLYGINIRTEVSDKVSGAAQLLATATETNFNVEAEWAYVSYKFDEANNIRAGKLNLTTFLLSDYSTVGYLYPWIRPPVEVYANNPMKNFLGVELLNVTRFGKQTKLTSQFFVGSAQVRQGDYTFKATNGYGLNFQLDMPYVSLRVGGIVPTIQLESAVIDGAGRNNGDTIEIMDNDDTAVMLTVGALVDYKNFILYAEAISIDTQGDTQAIFPDQDGAYVTVGYQIGKYMPHVTVAQSSGPDVPPELAPLNPRDPVTQDSVALGLRYDVDDSVALKFEYQLVDLTDGKGDGFSHLEANDGSHGGTPGTIDSFNVISISMDVIF